MKKQLLLGSALGVLVAASPAVAQPPLPAPVYNWTGWYVGGNIGYSWGNGQVTYNEPAFTNFGSSLPTSLSGPRNLDGVIGGPQIGYNWQFNSTWVAGIETDFQWSGESASRSFNKPYTYSCDTEGGVCPATLSGTLGSSIEWFGTARLRLGWLANPATLFYATGGLAYGRVTAFGSFSDTGCTPTCAWSFRDSSVNWGWTVGGGIEAVVPGTINWTWKVEYLYIDLGSLSGSGFDTDFGGPYTWNAKFTDNIVRFGLNYAFH
jgi:outer membrane immunogenic protein